MAIPTNTPIEWRGTTQTLEASGASITSGSIAQADDANYDTVTHGEGAPDAEIVVSVTYSVAPTEGTQLAVLCRPLDVDSTNDTEAPEAARPTMVVASAAVNNVTTAQYLYMKAYGLPKLGAYYLYNVSTGQTVGSGWTMKITPLALTPKT